MIEKIVHTAKQTVKARVDIQSARACALEAVKAADPLSNPSVRINSLPCALPKQKSCRSGPARTAQDVNGSFANEAPVVGRDRVS